MTDLGLDDPAKAVRRRDRTTYSAVRLASAINVVGDNVGTCALPIFVLQTTGSVTMTGSIVTVSVIASILTGILAGPIIDRIGLRRTVMFSAAMVSVATCAIYLLYAVGVLSPWLLLLVSFLHTAADEPGRVGLLGILPVLAKQADVTLERANSSLRSVTGLANLFGPILAGVLISLVGSSMVILINGVTGAVATVIIFAFLRKRRWADATAATAADTGQADPDAELSYFRRFWSGLRFLLKDRVLGTLMVSTMIFSSLDTSFATITLTAFSDEVLGNVTMYGALISAFGLGSLTGTITFGIIGHRLPQRAAYITAYLSFGIMVLLLTMGPGTGYALGIMVVAGLVTSPIDMVYLTALQRRVPAHLFGRVSSIVTTVVATPAPIFITVVAWLISGQGVSRVLMVLGIGYLGVTAVLVFVRPLRGLNAQRMTGST